MRVFICFCLLFVSSFKAASIEPVVISHSKGNFYPFEYVDKGEFKGLHADLIRAAAKRLNIKVTFVSLTWMRSIKDLSYGWIDAVSYFSYTPERAIYAEFVPGNILSSTTTFPIILAQDKQRILFDGTIASLRPYRIAVGAGFKYGEPFDSAKGLLKVQIPEPSPQKLVDLLKFKRVDIIITAKHSLRQLFSPQQIKQSFHIFDQPVATNPVYLAFSKVKKHQVLAQRFAKAMSEFKAREEYRKLLVFYGESEG
ncbi:MAG: transporter substrate-binding domain-containing protein [Psychrosphaera sp.]|nr:transporter substrate-binding domain-containing protein [Psychrosphaera sp.]